MKQRKKLGRKILGVLLTLAMIIGLMPGMGLTAYAATTSTVTYKLSEDGRTINKSGITCSDSFDGYNNITGGGTFYLSSGNFKKIVVTAEDIRRINEDRNHNTISGWSVEFSSATWTATWTGNASSVQFGNLMGNNNDVTIVFTIEVYGYSVTITPGNNMTKTTDSGAASQTGVTDAITDVVYTANEGYMFPATSDLYTTTNGIKVERTSDTVVTVSGTPTGVANITIPDAIPGFKLLDDTTKPVIKIKRGETEITEGVPQVGDVMTAETGATNLVYEWYRDGNEAISGATNSTYTLTKDDVGKAISVKVYQTKNESGTELTGGDRPAQTSEATTEVEKKTPAELSADDAKTKGITFTYADEAISAKDGYEVSSTNVGDGTAITSLTGILDGDGTPTIYVRTKATDDTAAGSWVAVTFTARPDAPTGLSAEPPAGTADGKIKGTTTSMEYKLKNGTGAWTGASDSETSVAAGTYLVRTKANDNTPAGRTTEVAVITATQKVTNLINDLPEAVNVTVNDKNAIEAARTAYDALSTDEKANFPAATLKKLTDAEDALAAATVSGTINALPVATNVTTDNKAAIEAARAAYSALTDAQKEYVSEATLKKLTEAEAALAAAPVNDTINALPVAADVTTTDKAAIEAARAAYNALTDVQRAYVSEATLKKLTDAEAALAAAPVNDTINALPVAADVTTENKAAIEAARAAYNALTDAQKAYVSEATLKKLTDAEAALKDAEDQAKADEVIAKINALPEADKVTADNEAAIKAAREAYKGLTEDQQNKISADILKKLTDAETALDTVNTNAAKEVSAAIDKLPASDKVAATDKEAIEAARKAYDALTPDQKKLVDEATFKKLTDAETALAAAQKKETDDTSAADKVVITITALPVASKVTVTDKASIEAARKAYDALSAEQKKKVSADTLKKLTDAETALKAAEDEEAAAAALAAAKAESQAAMNEQVTVTQKGNKFTVKWNKSSSADGYYVYAGYCGKKTDKPVKTITKNTTTKTTITKINGKKINQKKNFHVYVVPYKIIDGKKVALGKSTVAHLVGTKNKKYTNVKSIKLTKKAYTVAVGKTAKVKAKIKLVDKKKKHIPESHGAKFRYRTSDSSIATVSKSGKIKGINKGTCTIYVYAINGKMKKVKVTVK